MDDARAEYSQQRSRLQADTDEGETMPLPETSTGLETGGMSEQSFGQRLKMGLAFTLPLIVFGLIALFLFLWMSAPSSLARMARKRASNNTPLNQKQQELAARGSDLRKQMDDLQRMIEDAPRVAEERTRREREELLERATKAANGSMSRSRSMTNATAKTLAKPSPAFAPQTAQ